MNPKPNPTSDLAKSTQRPIPPIITATNHPKETVSSLDNTIKPTVAA